MTGAMRTAVRQNIKSKAGGYTGDGPQAYYLLRVGDVDTWYTEGDKAIAAYENRTDWAGVELWVRRTDETQLRQIR